MFGPGVVVETNDPLGEVLIPVRRHLAIMPWLIVEFSASQGGFTIVNCSQDSGK
jgi:hypothetical protein